MMPRFPAVNGKLSDSTNDVWPDPASEICCAPRRVPASSQTVAVTFVPLVVRLTNATPNTYPAVLSNGRVWADATEVCSGTVASDGLSLVGVDRRIAKPPTGPELSTSAHPTIVFANGPVAMTMVAFGLSAALIELAVRDWLTPCWLNVKGRLKGVPSSARKAAVIAIGMGEVLMSVIAVSHHPP